MSSIHVNQQAVIENLKRLYTEILELQEKQKQKYTEYNSLLKNHFGLEDVGKPLSIVEMISLIQKVKGGDLLL